MKQVLFFLLCVFSLESGATYITTGVTGLDVSPDHTEDVIVMTTSGDVLWVPTRDTALITKLKKAIKTRQLIELEVNQKSLILRGKLLDKKYNPAHPADFSQESNFQAYKRNEV